MVSRPTQRRFRICPDGFTTERTDPKGQHALWLRRSFLCLDQIGSVAFKTRSGTFDLGVTPLQLRTFRLDQLIPALCRLLMPFGGLVMRGSRPSVPLGAPDHHHEA